MSLTRFARWVLVAMVAIAATPGLASADVIFTLGKIYNGDTPVGAAPWARATFSDLGTNKVKLTMENLATGNTGQFITNWTFNVSDTRFLDDLAFTYSTASVGSNQAIAINVDANDVDAGGGGALGRNFDIGFDFESANGGSKKGPISSGRFIQGETCIYEIGYGGSQAGFSASLFNALTSEDLYTSAHIQGIPAGSGTTSGVATVPEPTSLALWSLLGAAGIGLAVVRHRRARS